jgi:uracil phosphoribosyltransferase
MLFTSSFFLTLFTPSFVRTTQILVLASRKSVATLLAVVRNPETTREAFVAALREIGAFLFTEGLRQLETQQVGTVSACDVISGCSL